MPIARPQPTYNAFIFTNAHDEHVINYLVSGIYGTAQL